MTMNLLSWTEATRRARKILSSGYFAASTEVVYVYHPETRARIELYGQCGRPPKRSDMVDQLAQALIDAELDR